jgi:outer membrane receptor protein involved in Fe transport
MSVKWTQRTTWYVGDFNIGYRWRLLLGTDFETPAAAIPQFQSISTMHYVDFVVGWTPTNLDALEGFTFQVGLENAFDEDPPIVGSEAGTTTQNSGNTFPGDQEVLARCRRERGCGSRY